MASSVTGISVREGKIYLDTKIPESPRRPLPVHFVLIHGVPPRR